MGRGIRTAVKQAVRELQPAQATQDEIAKVAFELFERRGRIHGHDQQDWFEAERIARARRRSGNGRSRAATS